jgi:membrane protease YdiL (CAAX protease family)
MSQDLITQVLAMALVVIVTLYLHQIPGMQTGNPDTRPLVLQWIGIFLAIWLGLQFILETILLAVLISVYLPQGADLTNIFKFLTEHATEILFSNAVIGVISVLVAAYVAQVRMRHRPIRELGWRPYRGWGWDCAMGTFLGFIGFALLFVLAMLTGKVTLGTEGTLPGNILPSFLLNLLILIMIAFSEELLIRGFILQVLEVGWGTAAAVVLSSLLWGIAHLFNPSASGAAALNIVAAGMIYGFGFVITRSLWLPFFLHLSWNLFQGPIFGFTVSGLSFPSIFTSTLPGTEYVTGGSFGPEAGLVLIPILVLQMIILRWWMGFRAKLGVETVPPSRL